MFFVCKISSLRVKKSTCYETMRQSLYLAVMVEFFHNVQSETSEQVGCDCSLFLDV